MTKTLTMDFAGATGVKPRKGVLITTDLYADVIAAGYLDSQTHLGQPLEESDFIFASYGDGHAVFNPSITDGVVTLVPILSSAYATLPVTDGIVTEFDGTTGKIKAGPVAANKLLTSGITTPDVSPNLVSFNVTVGQAALASGGAVALITSSGSKQYKIKELQMNLGGTNFSGGSGNRLGQVTDGTTVYSVVPAASLQTLANAQWGVTALPNPASAAINTSTVAGANLSFKYSGGTTDYTAGSVVISGLAERVA